MERNATAAMDALFRRPFATADELETLLAKAKSAVLSPEEKARMETLKRAFHQNFKSFQTEAKALVDAMARESAAVQTEIVQLHLDMLGQTRRKLKPFKGRAVLLQIASLQHEVHVFVTGPNSQVHRTAPVPRAALARMAFEGWNAVARASPDVNGKLQSLYEVLIRPVEQDLKDSGAEVVMLNLEGFLRYIPFAALRNGGRYFVEDYALAIQTPAADTQYQAGERDRARAVGFGVTDALRDFSGLPGVARELESIFDGADSAGVLSGMPRLNSEFNADDFALALEERPQFVHIASHFKLEPGDESKSFLLLGTGDALTLETIRTDPRFQFMDVDLLTLSACETAGEVGSDGKEVESFATLAQASGASSVMATLWPIADESTATLMTDFYKGLLDAKLDKALALQQAQVAMIRAGDGAGHLADPGAVPRGVQGSGGTIAVSPEERQPLSHPYYWSAFILMGNWL
jgi:CHAT domain-containing protein